MTDMGGLVTIVGIIDVVKLNPIIVDDGKPRTPAPICSPTLIVQLLVVPAGDEVGRLPGGYALLATTPIDYRYQNAAGAEQAWHLVAD